MSNQKIKTQLIYSLKTFTIFALLKKVKPCTKESKTYSGYWMPAD